MTEMEILARIDEINLEYTQLSQLKDYDLTLEAIGDKGDVKVTLRKGEISFEKTIAPTDSLEWICDTFSYPEIFSLASKDIALDGLKMAYFDSFGRLVVERQAKGYPSATEIFKIKDHQRDKIKELLREQFGSKFKG